MREGGIREGLINWGEGEFRGRRGEGSRRELWRGRRGEEEEPEEGRQGKSKRWKGRQKDRERKIKKTNKYKFRLG